MAPAVDLNAIFTAVETTQTAKATGAALIVSDQTKLNNIQAQLATDTTNQVPLVASADKAIDDAVAALLTLKSAPEPVPVPVAVPPTV